MYLKNQEPNLMATCTVKIITVLSKGLIKVEKASGTRVQNSSRLLATAGTVATLAGDLSSKK